MRCVAIQLSEVSLLLRLDYDLSREVGARLHRTAFMDAVKLCSAETRSAKFEIIECGSGF